MPSAQRSVVINRPVDQVFAFFTDPTNELKWRTHLKEVTAEGPIGVGSRVHQVVKGPGRGIPADIEITAQGNVFRFSRALTARISVGG